MAGEAGAGSSQRTGRRESRIRHDPTGTITRSLGELIEQGYAITLGLQALAREPTLDRPSKTIERWRLACLRTLHTYFEREAALEFLRASDPTSTPDEQTPAVRGHIQRMHDALALLLALKGTLERRDHAIAYRGDVTELRGLASQAPSAQPAEQLAPSQH